VARGRALSKEGCNALTIPGLTPTTDDPCFGYDLSDQNWSETMTVYTSCETGEWRINGFGP
jgi:hypothetical protein